MPIFYNKDTEVFTLETENTRYAIQIIKGLFPVHLYYGEKNDNDIELYKWRIMSFSPYYKDFMWHYMPDTAMNEYIGFDSGDFRSSSLKIKNCDGNCVTMLRYTGYEIIKGRAHIPNMPSADADEDTETLIIRLTDEYTKCDINLYYTVFPHEDVISRYVKVTNNGSDTVSIEKCMSLTLDLPHHEFDMISLYGRHYMERNYQRRALAYGTQNIYSRRGASSHQFNPFFALCTKDANETAGEVYGFNFVYSGNFMDEVEVDQTGGTRVNIGINEENFSWELKRGDSFSSPEAVMTYSNQGIGKMSRNFHKFVNKRILPPEPFDKRPVALNTWEACYFKIDEKEMLRFAEAAKETGIDLLVMDDGWFGQRNDDQRALGDWFVNEEKFKEGLAPFIDKVKSYGIKFGIWVEPEMINADSDLYRAHPDWCLHCKGRERLESRYQLVLDMGNPEVIEYLKNSFSETFKDLPIDYFKWDMNRHISQAGSIVLPPHRQGEASHRYILGTYELFRWFRETYPNAMIENCSGGGGRYDLGMMKYSTMIWTSDNTVPQDRIGIQYSSMLAYPASTMSCHVSNHNNICDVPRELEYRYQIAIGGALGYEFHLPNCSDEIKDTVRRQVADYRKYEKTILTGEYFSLLNPFETNYSAYYYTNEDRSEILLSFLQKTKDEGCEVVLQVEEAKENAVYIDTVTSKEYSGKELKCGIIAYSDNSGCNSQIWHFVKK